MMDFYLFFILFYLYLHFTARYVSLDGIFMKLYRFKPKYSEAVVLMVSKT